MGCAEEPKPSVCLAQVQVVSTPAAHSACELQNCWELLSSRLLCSTWQVQQQKSSCTHTVGDLTVLSYFSPSAADSISLRATLSKNQTVGSLKKKNRNTSSEMVLQSGFVFFFFFFFYHLFIQRWSYLMLLFCLCCYCHNTQASCLSTVVNCTNP